MAKIAFTTLGCKLNYAETSTYERALLSAGHEAVAWNEVADVYLINTCAVTTHAEQKSRGFIRRAHKKAPGAAIVVTGCYAELIVAGAFFIYRIRVQRHVSGYTHLSENSCLH